MPNPIRSGEIEAKLGSLPQITVRNQLNAPLRQDIAGLRHGQHAKFKLSRLLQTSLRRREVRVVIARMTDELPGSLGNALGDGLKQGFVERSRYFDAECASRCYEVFLSYRPTKLSSKAAQYLYLSQAGPEVGAPEKLTGTEREPRTKRISHRVYPALPSCPQHWTKDLGKDVRVLVRIDVRDDDPGGLDLLNLPPGLGFNFRSFHTARECSCREGFESVAEAFRICDCGECGSIQDGLSVNENNVAPDTQIRGALCQLYGLGKRSAICHQGRGSYDATLMRLDNGAVHTWGESEVVRINDQPPQASSLAREAEIQLAIRPFRPNC